MFDRHDIYTTSGSVILQNSWTEKVTKFDTSSFYHWEQDNEPLYDLEERTYANWEQLGFPTSSIPGLALTVSGAAVGTVAPEVTPTSNNVFLTVSAAIDALPKILRFPVLIEVASYGDLGELNLDNIRIAQGGSLEIINRNFAKVYSASAFVNKVHEGKYAKYNILSSISSLDLSNTFVAASAVDVSTTILSSTSDPRFTGSHRTIFQAPGFNGATPTNRLAVSLKDSNIRWPATNDANIFKFTPYELDQFGSDQVHGGDCSSFNECTGDEIFRDHELISTTSAMGLVYGNYVSSIRVQNCDGPIYLRNFIAQGFAPRKDVGVKIANTNNLLLENMGSVGFSEAGFDILGSNVTITRGIAGYRNYPLRNVVRAIDPWQSLSSLDDLNVSGGVGLRAINSIVTLSSTLEKEPTGASAADFLINFSRNNIGVKLENSVLKGGIPRYVDSDERSASHFITELNVDAGIRADNSLVLLDGRLHSHGNGNGVVLNNSKAEFDEFVIEKNQRKGILARASEIFYNRNRKRYSTSINQFELSSNGQHLVLDSGSLFSPVYTSSMPDNTGDMKFNDSHGLNKPTVLGTASTEHINRTWLPAISIDGGSKGIFVHTLINREGANVITGTTAGESVYGAALAAKNNSKALFQGSKSAATVIKGPDDGTTNATSYAYQQHKSGVYAKDNSEIEFNGPTVIAQYAVDALAEDGSVININPPKLQPYGGLDVSGFNLVDTENHTSVELHSTRACLVANRNSTINMKDVGDFGHAWGKSLHANGITAMGEGPDYITSAVDGGQDISGFTWAGSLQFYPNSNSEVAYDSDPNTANAGQAVARIGTDHSLAIADTFTAGTGSLGHKYNYNLANYHHASFFRTGATYYASALTSGGTCIKATGGSVVNAQNVHFPCGWWNPSGIYYDSSSGTVCDRLFIWNIADKSHLHASYCTVSGVYPQDAGYFGPSATWTSGTGLAPAFGAPSSTPSTSSLSVLDFYGLSSGGSDWLMRYGNAWAKFPYGFKTHENQGPFRLYVSVDPLANQLSSIGVVGGSQAQYGYQPQVFAQGYNLSGPMSASGDVSGLYGKALQVSSSYHTRTDIGGGGTVKGITASGFYYCSSMVDPGTHSRILLDESAANTFANAKNGAMGTSGRAQICTIYTAHTGRGGESASDAVKTNGRGYKSSNTFDLGRDN